MAWFRYHTSRASFPSARAPIHSSRNTSSKAEAWRPMTRWVSCMNSIGRALVSLER